MDAGIIEALAHIDQEHLDLLGLPAQALHERALGDGGQALHEDHAQEPDALLALAAVAGPAADGQLVAGLSDVVEAGVAEPLGQPVDHVQVQPQGGDAHLHVVAEVAEGIGGRVCQGAVV